MRWFLWGLYTVLALSISVICIYTISLAPLWLYGLMIAALLVILVIVVLDEVRSIHGKE